MICLRWDPLLTWKLFLVKSLIPYLGVRSYHSPISGALSSYERTIVQDMTKRQEILARIFDLPQDDFSNIADLIVSFRGPNTMTECLLVAMDEGKDCGLHTDGLLRATSKMGLFHFPFQSTSYCLWCVGAKIRPLPVPPVRLSIVVTNSQQRRVDGGHHSSKATGSSIVWFLV